MTHRPARKSKKQTWTIPIVLALLTLFGLVLALTGDGAVDLLASVALAVPLIVALLAIIRSKRKR